MGLVAGIVAEEVDTSGVLSDSSPETEIDRGRHSSPERVCRLGRTVGLRFAEGCDSPGAATPEVACAAAVAADIAGYSAEADSPVAPAAAAGFRGRGAVVAVAEETGATGPGFRSKPSAVDLAPGSSRTLLGRSAAVAA